MTARHPRAFTLLELAVTLAIASVIATLSVAALDGLKRRSTLSAATGDLVAGLYRTRAEAFARGAQTSLVVDTVNGRWWGVQGEVVPSAFDPAAPGPLIAQGTLPAGLSFGPSDGYDPDNSLPVPFAGIKTRDDDDPEPNYPYCSFCETGGGRQGYGAIIFEPGGPVRFSGGPVAVGQQFTLTWTTGGTTNRMAVAVVGRTGVTQVFERQTP